MNRRSGFVLIATSTLMMLFAVIALGMINLSTTAQRTSTHVTAEAAAQANARMALMMAIGQLQQLSGADTRVTASSTMFGEGKVQLTGVWRSWEGSDRLDDGQPVAPNYAMKFKAGEIEGSDPDAGFSGSPNDGRFLGWLTSAEELPDSPSGEIPVTSISNSKRGGMVPILGANSVNVASQEVYIKPTSFEGDHGYSGGVAWWTSGENQKAMINKASDAEPDSIAQWQQRVRAGGRPDPEVFDLKDDENNNLVSDKSIPSLASLELLPDSPDAQEFGYFHDLTVFSSGLLTNTANGGWRRDLSLMTESYDGDSFDGDPAYHSTESALPSEGLPFYTIKPGVTGMARKATGSNAASGALLYPWAAYRDVAGRPESYAGPIGSWTSLVDYSMQYKQLRRFSSSKTQYAMREERIEDWPTEDAGSAPQNRMLYADKVRVLPVFARIHFIFSLASEAGSDPNDPSVTGFHPQLLITPIVTMWNPYNVQLEIDRQAVPHIRLYEALAPLRFKINVNGQPLYPAADASGSHFIGNSLYDMMRHMWGKKNQLMSLNLPNGGNLTLEPGEARLYSIANPNPQSASKPAFTLTDRYVPGGGFLIDLLDLSEVPQEKGEKSFDSNVTEFGSTNNFTTIPEDFVYHGNSSNRINKLLIDGATSFTAVAISVTGMNKGGIGYLTEFNNSGMGGGKGRIYSSIKSSFMVENLAHGGVTGDQVIESIWPNLDDGGNLLSGDISSFASSGRSGHFAAAIQSLRGASPLSSFEEFEYHHLESKGMLQTNPLSFTAQMGGFADKRPGGKDLAFASMAGTGAYHPINSPMEFSFRPLAEIGSQYGWLPEGTDGTSYFMSGMLPTDGLTRSIIAEIPTRPLQSLVDLQHWDARAANPVPPFQFNLIGNGSATPIIPSDRLSVKGGNGALNEHMCNDDSYLLNQMLFDDWFVSSIAPDFGDEGVSEERSLADVYKDHLSGEVPLPNRFYVPSHEAASDDVDAAVAEVVSGSKSKDSNLYAYESIASKLTVNGMFNVNSASLDAWRALLRQGGSMAVPYLDADGRTSLDKARSYSFPRTSIAGDQGSNSGSRESGNPIFGAAEFAGHRVLTEEQIDALAEEIVSEIRERGPFLSLSEFVNRQVTSDKDLAIAGTIQKALDNLAALGPNSPLNPFAELQANSVEITSQPPGNPDYGFPEAALGYASFGAPGWVRQADILRPLAPRLSARDDTFTIRAYGEARDPANPSKVIARAWCEAVVVRSAEYVDPVDDATVLPYSAEMKSKANRQFGRKYRTMSFRWLNPSEI